MNLHTILTGAAAPQGEVRRRGTAETSAAECGGKPDLTIKLLNDALAITRAVAARCERQYCAALRSASPALAAAALEHANAARLDGERIRARITDLGGVPDPTSSTAGMRTPAECRLGNSLGAVIGGYLVATHATIESYREIAMSLEACDQTTQALIGSIVAGGEACATVLAGLLEEASTPVRD